MDTPGQQPVQLYKLFLQCNLGHLRIQTLKAQGPPATFTIYHLWFARRICELGMAGLRLLSNSRWLSIGFGWDDNQTIGDIFHLTEL